MIKIFRKIIGAFDNCKYLIILVIVLTLNLLMFGCGGEEIAGRSKPLPANPRINSVAFKHYGYEYDDQGRQGEYGIVEVASESSMPAIVLVNEDIYVEVEIVNGLNWTPSSVLFECDYYNEAQDTWTSYMEGTMELPDITGYSLVYLFDSTQEAISIDDVAGTFRFTFTAFDSAGNVTDPVEKRIIFSEATFWQNTVHYDANMENPGIIDVVQDTCSTGGSELFTDLVSDVYFYVVHNSMYIQLQGFSVEFEYLEGFAPTIATITNDDYAGWESITLRPNEYTEFQIPNLLQSAKANYVADIDSGSYPDYDLSTNMPAYRMTIQFFCEDDLGESFLFTSIRMISIGNIDNCGN
ncbi:MAG: hypothetical protein GY874_03045 [Desulfobacteraceae bacterium]|nr:hypothetical protein [Desulfobacteraceae bacterium]